MKTARAALSHPTDPTGARCHRQAVPRAADTAAVGPTGVVGSEGAGFSVRAPTARLRTRGLVVAATGNGTIHVGLEAALRRAQAQGVRVVRASRCASGRVLPTNNSEFAHSHGLSPVKARIALMLDLMLR